MPKAKAKPFTRGGWRGEFSAKLPSDQVRTLERLGCSTEDLRWIEDQMMLYRMALHVATRAPTPAEIKAALDDGIEAIVNLQNWFQHVDDETSNAIEMVAYEAGQQQYMFKAVARGLVNELNAIADLLGSTQQRIDAAVTKGRRPTSNVDTLNTIMFQRFGEEKGGYVVEALINQHPKNTAKHRRNHNRTGN